MVSPWGQKHSQFPGQPLRALGHGAVISRQQREGRKKAGISGISGEHLAQSLRHTI